jgi:hypothetical protein
MMDKNTTMTTTLDEIVTKVVQKEAANKRENRLTPAAMLFAKKGGKGGRGGKVSKSPKRNKRDNKRDNKKHRNEKDLRKCFDCQWRGHLTNKCVSKQRSDPPKAADTTTGASTEASATSTLTTPIENNWITSSTNTSSSDCFINCGCTTHITGH